jgi:hypothetical protein
LTKIGRKKLANATILAFPLSKSISKCNKLWFKQTPQQLGSSSHNIPIDNRRFLNQSLKDHNNRVFSRWDDRPKVRRGWPTDGPAMPPSPIPGAGCVALRAFLMRGSAARSSWRLLTRRMKFEMRCLVVIPLSLPCLLDSKVTHFEWVGNRLMMKQEEAVGASDLCASSSSG